eukprot:1421356-Prymnesium_polylepis.1
MKLPRRRSRVSRRMLPAPYRCAPRAERPKIFAGPHVWLRLSCDPRDVQRAASHGGLKSTFQLSKAALCRALMNGTPSPQCAKN